MKNKSLLIILMLIAMSSLPSCRRATPHPSTWSDQKLSEWFGTRQYLNGLQMLPDSSINRRNFAVHYFEHKETWDKAFAFMKNSDFATMPLGRIELGGDLYATVSEYRVAEREGAFLESHKKYIDIQCVVSGSEVIDVAPVKHMTVTKPYDSKTDVQFGVVDEFSELKARHGHFLSFFLPTPTARV